MPYLSKKNTLVGIVGLAAAAILYVTVPQFEGEVLEGYLDPVGVATKCYGDTEDVIVGQEYTRQECLQSLEKQLIRHADGVISVIPEVKKSPEMTASFTSLAYNIGNGAFARSTVVKRFRAGDYAGACEAMKMWKYADGKELPGLVVRRDHEATLCLRGVPAMEGK